MRLRFALPIFVATVVAVCTSPGCTGDPGRPSPPDDPRYCTLRYTLDAGALPVCASVSLDGAALDRLARQLDEVRALYPRFAGACGVSLDELPEALTLHVVRYDELNDRAAFPRDERTGNILGRYYVGRQAVFVTERALDDGGAIHLPHELAHWLNDHAGVDDPDEDERLASAFHRFYRSRQDVRARPLLAERTPRASLPDDGPLPSDPESAALDRSLVEQHEPVGRAPSIDDLCGRRRVAQK